MLKKPYVIINCAMTADGKIAFPDGKQLRISCEEDIKRMYELRNRCDAVLVGVNTVLYDDPKLTIKKKYVRNPKQPLRIVLDSKCRTPKNAQVLSKAAKTLIVTQKGNEKTFAKKHVEVIGCKTDEDGLINLEAILDILYRKKGIRKLLVEGGGTVIWNFLKKRMVDEVYTYIGPFIVGGKNTPTMAEGSGINSVDELIHLRIVDVKPLGPGVLIHYKPIVD